MTLTAYQRREIIRLLGMLQTHLESCIETATPPGSEQEAADIEMDRRDWKAAEKVILMLEGKPYIRNPTPPGTANARPPEAGTPRRR